MAKVTIFVNALVVSCYEITSRDKIDWSYGWKESHFNPDAKEEELALHGDFKTLWSTALNNTYKCWADSCAGHKDPQLHFPKVTKRVAVLLRGEAFRTGNKKLTCTAESYDMQRAIVNSQNKHVISRLEALGSHVDVFIRTRPCKLMPGWTKTLMSWYQSTTVYFDDGPLVNDTKSPMNQQHDANILLDQVKNKGLGKYDYVIMFRLDHLFVSDIDDIFTKRGKAHTRTPFVWSDHMVGFPACLAPCYQDLLMGTSCFKLSIGRDFEVCNAAIRRVWGPSSSPNWALRYLTPNNTVLPDPFYQGKPEYSRFYLLGKPEDTKRLSGNFTLPFSDLLRMAGVSNTSSSQVRALYTNKTLSNLDQNLTASKQKAAGLLHEGEVCLERCGDNQGTYRQGRCAWCGTGLCCKKGWSDVSNGCDGTLGIDGLGHVCVAAPGRDNRSESNGDGFGVGR